MRKHLVFSCFVLALLVAGCSLNDQLEPPGPRTLTLSPSSVSVEPGEAVDFEADLNPDDGSGLAWSYEAGTLTANGRTARYTAPTVSGDYEITVELVAEEVHATATVTVGEPHPLTPGIALKSTSEGDVMATGTTTTISASFAAWLTGVSPDDIEWQVSGGTIAATGATASYTAPTTTGEYVVKASVPGVAEAFGSLVIEVPGAIIETFTIVVIPDTQTLTIDGDPGALVKGIGEWIVENVDERNIAFVSQVGDVVWDANDFKGRDAEAQWEAARAGIDLLDGVLPYSVAMGDHEYFHEADKAGSTDAYLEHFGPSRYTNEGYDWYGGSHPDGLNHYQIFEAGGREFLHLTLEWEPLGEADEPSTPLGWAYGVLEDHRDLPTLITTHAYLWDMPGQEGRFPVSAREGYLGSESVKADTASGEDIFETLVEPFPQVFMVFNGHYHKAKQSPEVRGEYHQTSTNDSDSLVYEMLANYQWMSYDDDPDWIRLIEFVPGEGGGPAVIDVSTFSPSRAGSDDAFRNTPRSSFDYSLDLVERFDFD